MLYLGRRRNAYLMGLELAESEALLDAASRRVMHRTQIKGSAAPA